MEGARVVALRARNGLGVVSKGTRLKLRALWAASNAIIDRRGERQKRSAEGALCAEAEICTKEDAAQGALEPEKEVPGRLVLLVCEESHAALIVVRELLGAPPDAGESVVMISSKQAF